MAVLFCGLLILTHPHEVHGDSSVWGWGANDSGQTNVPVGLSNVVMVTSGMSHNMALRSDGTIVVWGSGAFGLTNPPAGLSGVRTIAAGYNQCLAVKTNGSVAEWGSVNPLPQNLTNVIAVAGGMNHSLALKADGTVVGWGSPFPAKIPAGLNSVGAIAAGAWHSLALKSDGTVQAWGLNWAGQTNVPAGLNHVVAIAGGTNFSVALRANGTVVAWGANDSGQTNVPPGLTNVVQISAGLRHVIALRSDGTLVAWGNNSSGQCTIPPGLSGIVGFSAGDGDSVVLTGSVAPFFTRVPSDTTALGRQGFVLPAAAVGTTPLFYQWSINGVQVLGATNPALVLPDLSFDQKGTYSLYVSNSVGTATASAQVWLTQVQEWSGSAIGPTNPPAGLINVVSLAAGSSHTLALKSDGTVVAWGSNLAREENIPPGLNGVVAISAGQYDSLALKSDGTLVAWGNNSYGQSTVPVDLSNVVAIASGLDHHVALRADGTVVAWGNNLNGETNVPPGLSNVVAVGASESHSLALRADGGVVAWGGRLPVLTNVPPDLTNAVAIRGSVSFSVSHTLALRADGSLSWWGYPSTAVPGELTNEQDIAAGGFQDLALNADGTITGWGGVNQGGTPGLTNVDAISVGQDHSVALIGNGPPFLTAPLLSRTLALGVPSWVRAFATGTLPLTYQWRLNGTNLPDATTAQLPLLVSDGTQQGRYSVSVSNLLGEIVSPEFTVSAAPELIVSQPLSQVGVLGGSVFFSVAVVGQGPLAYQWQFNGTDLPDQTNATLQLAGLKVDQDGLYSVTISNVFGVVPSAKARLSVSQVAAWGANSLGETNLIPGLSNLVAVAAGGEHNLALRRDGTVIGWGDNTAGQSSVPTSLNNAIGIAAGAYHSIALRSDGTVLAWGANNYGQTNAPADLTNAVAIAAGSDFNLALRKDGTVTSWGITDFNQTNVPSGLTNVIAIAAGDSHALALEADGTVVAWGNNSFGQATVPSGLGKVIGIGAGRVHSLAIRSDGSLVEWGEYLNGGGGTGLPSVGAFSHVVAACGGDDHDTLLLEDGSITSFGLNGSGQTNMPAGLSNVCAVACGFGHSLALIGYGAPFLINQLLDQAITYGTPTVFSARASGSGPLFYQWRFDGTNLPGATDSNLVITNTVGGNAGRYSVTVSNAFGITTSSEASIAVVPLKITVPPAATTTFLGNTAVLNVTALGQPPLTYQWTFNNSPLAGATNSSLMFTDLQLNQSGNYAVTVSGPTLSVRSPDAPLNVTEVAAWGLDDSTNVTPDLTNVLAVAGGLFHSLALRADGTVAGWSFGNYGGNDFGQAVPPPFLSNVVAITAGEFDSQALLANGSVVGWGFGNFGQTTAPVDLTNAVAVATGSGHTLGLRADGTVAAWGADAYGQIDVPAGLSNVVALAAAGTLSVALTADGTVVEWGGISPPIVPLTATNILAIAAGEEHVLALLGDRTVMAWNLDGTLQTDVPTEATNGVAISAGTGHNLVLRMDGSAVTWPDTNTPPALRTISGIASGYYHNLALVTGSPPRTQALAHSATLDGNGFSLTLPTRSGRVYLLEYKNSLTDPSWTRSSLVSGNGAERTLTDPTAATTTRFYRVREW